MTTRRDIVESSSVKVLPSMAVLVAVALVSALAIVGLFGRSLTPALAQTCTPTAQNPYLNIGSYGTGYYACDTGEQIEDWTSLQQRPAGGGAWNNAYGSSRDLLDSGAHSYLHDSYTTPGACGWAWRSRAEEQSHYGVDKVSWSGALYTC
jgi:hypothetical protein